MTVVDRADKPHRWGQGHSWRPHFSVWSPAVRGGNQPACWLPQYSPHPSTFQHYPSLSGCSDVTDEGKYVIKFVSGLLLTVHQSS